MKKLGLGLGIVVILLVGAILIVPSFLDWNEYKVQIEQTASDYTGRQVKIKGDISLSLLPTSALSAKDVSVTNLPEGRADHMLSLKSLDVKVSFPSVISSLFGGKVKVEKFILVDPVIALEILADGRSNWTFGDADADAATVTPQGSSADISFDKFQIVNGQISFEDMASGKMELLRKINANVKVNSIDGPYEVAGSAKYEGLDTTMTLNLGKNRPGKKVPLALSLGLLDEKLTANVMGSVILSGVDSVFAGQVTIKAEDVADVVTVLDRFQGKQISSLNKVGQDFSLDMQVHALQNKMSLTEINLQSGQSRGQGQADISLSGDKAAPTLRLVSKLAINKIDLDTLLSSLDGAATAVVVPEKSVTPAQKTDDSDWLSHISGKLDVTLGALKYNDKVASQIGLATEAADGIITISSLKAHMPGGSAISFNGAVTADDKVPTAGPVLDGKLTLNASNLRGLLNWLKLDVDGIPSGQLAQFSYQSHVKLTGDMLQLYGMNGKLDTMRFGGGLSSALGVRPSFGVRLEVQNLNLDSYLASASEETPDYKARLAVLDEFDMTYDISAQDLSLQNVKIASAKLEGTLLGGALAARVIDLQDAAGLNIKASGKGLNFSTKPEASLTFAADAKSLVTMGRSLKLNNGVDLEKFGETKVAGSLAATFEKVDLDVKSTVGVNKLDVKGTIRSATLKQLPEVGSMDLEVDGRSTSLASVIDQFDLGLTKPHAKDDRPVRLRGRVKTSADMIDLDGTVNIAAGQMVIKARQKTLAKVGALDLALDIKAAETREFVRGLGIEFNPAASKLGALGLKIKVNGTGDKYDVSNIVGDVGPVKLNGSGHVNMGLKKPTFNFNLKSGDIPLHDFLPKQAARQASQDGYGDWSSEPMDLSVLTAYEGRAHISAASLRYNKYTFENPTFETSLKDGVLSVSNFTGRLFGGEVMLAGDLNGNGVPKIDVDITLKQGSLTKAVETATGKAPVTGFFDMTGHYAARGKSQQALMASLTGTGEIVASPGLVNGINIPALSDRLDKMDDKQAFLSLLGTALTGGTTAYKGGKSAITAKDGKLSFSPLNVELEGAKSKLNMAIDLAKWQISSDGQLSLVDHPMAPPIELAISGDVSTPKVAFKTDRLQKYVGAKIASNMLQKLVGGEGGIEGLFGEQPKTEGTTGEQDAPNSIPDPAPVKDPVTKDPAQEFGKRLMEKLFEKKKTPPADGEKPPPEK